MRLKVVVRLVLAVVLCNCSMRQVAIAADAAEKVEAAPNNGDLLSQLCISSLRDFVHGSCADCPPHPPHPPSADSTPSTPPHQRGSNCCNNEFIRACFEHLERFALEEAEADSASRSLSDVDYGDEEFDLMMFPHEERRAKFRFGKRGRNTFLGKRSSDGIDDDDAEKRARNTFLGKRGDVEDLLKRARNTFLGKRLLPQAEPDKRARNTFLGKRVSAADDDGDEGDVEKRSRNKFLGKRAADKKSRNVFLGKRARNTFLGKREEQLQLDDVNDVDSGALHQVAERSRNKFLGKRGGGEMQQLQQQAPRIDRIDVSNAENDLDKRARNTFLGR